jgi:hypothetical protein
MTPIGAKKNRDKNKGEKEGERRKGNEKTGADIF